MPNTIWIARDKEGELYLYGEKPELETDVGMFCDKPDCDRIFTDNDTAHVEINPDRYPEVTFENSPKKLIIDDIKIMEDSRKIFIRGSKEHGDKVIRYLEEHGATVYYPPLRGDSVHSIYFIDHDDDIHFEDMDVELAKVIMEYYREVTVDEVIAYFAEKEKRFDYDDKHRVNGYWITPDSDLLPSNLPATRRNGNVFATEKQARSALAMSRISQYIANDPRYGGAVTDEEWKDATTMKYVLYRGGGGCLAGDHNSNYEFLAFHTTEQRDLFLTEHEDLVKEYLMIE